MTSSLLRPILKLLMGQHQSLCVIHCLSVVYVQAVLSHQRTIVSEDELARQRHHVDYTAAMKAARRHLEKATSSLKDGEK